ncbi:hypothetical protein H7X65_01690 [Candidatus Parcubacteria bacterium]|nr:hypothetical protein [Candidatus Parcubacteria bacterium]
MKIPHTNMPLVSTHLLACSYPPGIISWVYPEIDLVLPKHVLNAYDHLWFHPDQISPDTDSRPTGHEIRRMLTKEDLIHRCFDFRTLVHLEENPNLIPYEWVSLGVLALAWKSIAYNTDGDICVPHLNCRGKIPVIRWRPLAFRMNGAEATPLKIF